MESSGANETQTSTYKNMKKLINNAPEYDVVMHHRLAQDEFAIVVARDGAYAVCKTQPRRQIALMPNYEANGYGLLTSPLTSAGLGDLLQWTNRETAIERFCKLAKLQCSGASPLQTADTSR